VFSTFAQAKRFSVAQTGALLQLTVLSTELLIARTPLVTSLLPLLYASFRRMLASSAVAFTCALTVVANVALVEALSASNTTSTHSRE
jgi:hypothetical protein